MLYMGSYSNITLLCGLVWYRISFQKENECAVSPKDATQVVRDASNTYVNIEVGIGFDSDAPDSLGGSSFQVTEIAVKGNWLGL